MICVGGDEPEGWIAQSRSYFELCDSQNNIVDFKIVEGTNHFSLLDHAMSEDYELNKEVIEFGRIIKETINSYIKLRKSEINEFNNKEKFDKSKPVTQWERQNTLDC